MLCGGVDLPFAFNTGERRSREYAWSQLVPALARPQQRPYNRMAEE